MSNIFFTSDTHFGHKLMAWHRGFIPNVKEKKGLDELDRDAVKNCIAEMDTVLIENWNSRVKPTDTIYHLGDFSFLPYRQILPLLTRLNGRKHLLRGNHDKELDRASRHFIGAGYDTKVDFYDDYKEIKINEQKIVLFHYPLLTWNKSHYGSWHLHGHEHGSLPDNPNARRIDVGVDSVGTWIAPHFELSPISYDEVSVVINDKDWKPFGGTHRMGV